MITAEDLRAFYSIGQVTEIDERAVAHHAVMKPTFLSNL